SPQGEPGPDRDVLVPLHVGATPGAAAAPGEHLPPGAGVPLLAELVRLGEVHGQAVDHHVGERTDGEVGERPEDDQDDLGGANPCWGGAPGAPAPITKCAGGGTSGSIASGCAASPAISSGYTDAATASS